MADPFSTTRRSALRKELSLRDLVLFNVAAIVSTRWIAAAAHVGPGSLVLWMAAATLFLVPSAFVVARFSRLFPQQGGLYIWTREAFGDWHGFACAWFYYMNNLFWIPGALVAFIGMITYAFDARAAKLAEDPKFVLPCALVLLAAIVAANYVGLRVAKWVDNLGGISAYAIWVILVFAALFTFAKRGSATEFHFVPRLDYDRLNFWSQLAFAMTGLELCPIMSGEIRDARRAVFRATWISSALVVAFYVFGTSAILVFMGPGDVSPVIGLAQASQEASHVRWHGIGFHCALRSAFC